jgi:hypothetical protein
VCAGSSGVVAQEREMERVGGQDKSGGGGRERKIKEEGPEREREIKGEGDEREIERERERESAREKRERRERRERGERALHLPRKLFWRVNS